MQTAAAVFTETALHDSDELLGMTVLMHAKVYCFAHRFLIPRLEELLFEGTSGDCLFTIPLLQLCDQRGFSGMSYYAFLHTSV